MGESHNDEYYSVEDQRFLGEEGFGEEKRARGELMRNASRESRLKRPSRRSLGNWKQLPTRSEVRIGVGRFQRSEAVALLVRERGYRVSEVADFLRRDQANISTMLSRLAAREQR
jgi:hypothetical protein